MFFVPALGALVSLAGAGFIVHRAVRQIHDMREDAKHWRDEAFEMWHEMCALGTEATQQMPRVRGDLGKPLEIADQFPDRIQADPDKAIGTGRHHLRPRSQGLFHGQLPHQRTDRVSPRSSKPPA
ncbi:hypothetical protein [Amycolatopsis lurida]|uniref:hypothetical protein n=1 Tax=Amycolatopsis lurida TaxID=31959 RepID=UPI003665B17F